jgi:hypothetical protein
MPASTAAGWANYGYKTFNPLNTQLSNNKQYEGPETELNRGYNALFEFECFTESNGLGGNPTIRSYMHWAQFGTTSTGKTTNILDNCTIKENYYGGGNLANVRGEVVSTLTDCEVKGNAFGGGFSGRIEPFRIHNRNLTEFPYIDYAGIMHNGKLYFVKNTDGTDRYFTWCYRKSETEFFPEGVVIPNSVTTDNPTFEYPSGSNKWYVLTTVSLEGLGAISSDVELNLTGHTIVGSGTSETGNVFGGGNESEVNGSVTINISGTTEVKQNVYGGGNQAAVGQNTTVNLEGSVQVLGNVYGGGNNGPVGGNSQVNIQD